MVFSQGPPLKSITFLSEFYFPEPGALRLAKGNGVAKLAAVSKAKEDLAKKIEQAVARGQLMQPAAKNIRALLGAASSDLYPRVIEELVQAGEWDELNDRFYKTLEFGTGGLRGRTIGKIVTKAEGGTAAPNDRPQFPCVGTNAMNFSNVNRATQGLVAYLREWFDRRKISAKPKNTESFLDLNAVLEFYSR